MRVGASGCGGRDIGCRAGQLSCSDLKPGLGPDIRLNCNLSLSLSLSLCFDHDDRRTWDARCLAVRFGPWRARAVRLGGTDLVIRPGRGDRRGMGRQLSGGAALPCRAAVVVVAITWTGCSGRGAVTGGEWGGKLSRGFVLTVPGAAEVLAITWTGCSGRAA